MTSKRTIKCVRVDSLGNTTNETLSMARTIGQQADALRFRGGWNYDRVAKYLTKKFNVDLATLDELLRMSEEDDLLQENIKNSIKGSPR